MQVKKCLSSVCCMKISISYNAAQTTAVVRMLKGAGVQSVPINKKTTKKVKHAIRQNCCDKFFYTKVTCRAHIQTNAQTYVRACHQKLRAHSKRTPADYAKYAIAGRVAATAAQLLLSRLCGGLKKQFNKFNVQRACQSNKNNSSNK